MKGPKAGGKVVNLEDRQREMRERMMRQKRVPSYSEPVKPGGRPTHIPESLWIPEQTGEGRLKFPKHYPGVSREWAINVAKRVYLFDTTRSHHGIECVEMNKLLLLELIRIAEGGKGVTR